MLDARPRNPYSIKSLILFVTSIFLMLTYKTAGVQQVRRRLQDLENSAAAQLNSDLIIKFPNGCTGVVHGSDNDRALVTLDQCTPCDLVLRAKPSRPPVRKERPTRFPTNRGVGNSLPTAKNTAAPTAEPTKAKHTHRPVVRTKYPTPKHTKSPTCAPTNPKTLRSQPTEPSETTIPVRFENGCTGNLNVIPDRPASLALDNCIPCIPQHTHRPTPKRTRRPSRKFSKKPTFLPTFDPTPAPSKRTRRPTPRIQPTPFPHMQPHTHHPTCGCPADKVAAGRILLNNT